MGDERDDARGWTRTRTTQAGRICVRWVRVCRVCVARVRVHKSRYDDECVRTRTSTVVQSETRLRRCDAATTTTTTQRAEKLHCT